MFDLFCFCLALLFLYVNTCHSYTPSYFCNVGFYYSGGCYICPVGNYCPGDDQRYLCQPGKYARDPGLGSCKLKLIFVILSWVIFFNMPDHFIRPWYNLWSWKIWSRRTNVRTIGNMFVLSQIYLPIMMRSIPSFN